MKTVMVTGVGAIIGYGVLRALRIGRKDLRLVGSDIYADAVGQAWTDAFVQAPLTVSADYPAWLTRTLGAQRVDLVIPGIEQDVHFFSARRDLFADAGVKVALNAKALIELTQDKWLMDQALVAAGSSVRIPTRIDGDFNTLAAEFGLPFILKPRRSYASKGLLRVRREEDFNTQIGRLGAELIAQPCVGSDDQEYTVAIFGTGDGSSHASITMRRQLAADGSTVKAWVQSEPTLNAEIATLCRIFRPYGPTNLQFRKTPSGWKLLEINPRVSSSTSLRTAFGYNEAAMIVDHYLEERPIVQPTLRSGFAARFIEDFVVYDRDHF